MTEVERLMDFDNGEVRIQPIRYSIAGCKFMCVLSMAEQDESFWEKFDDMAGGDNEFSSAADFLTCKENQRKMNFVFCYGNNMQDCIFVTEQMASELLEDSQ